MPRKTRKQLVSEVLDEERAQEWRDYQIQILEQELHCLTWLATQEGPAIGGYVNAQ